MYKRLFCVALHAISMASLFIFRLNCNNKYIIFSFIFLMEKSIYTHSSKIESKLFITKLVYHFSCTKCNLLLWAHFKAQLVYIYKCKSFCIYTFVHFLEDFAISCLFYFLKYNLHCAKSNIRK